MKVEELNGSERRGSDCSGWESKSNEIRTACDLLRRARAQAQKSLRETAARAAIIEREAYDKGLLRGREEALGNTLDMLALRHALVTSLAADFQHALRAGLGSPAAPCRDQDPLDGLPVLLCEALNLFRGEPEIKIEAGPGVEDELRVALDALCREAGFGGKITLVEDSTLAAGEARLVANGCSILASPKAHLRRIFERLSRSDFLTNALRARMQQRIAEFVAVLEDGKNAQE